MKNYFSFKKIKSLSITTFNELNNILTFKFENRSIPANINVNKIKLVLLSAEPRSVFHSL